MRIALITVLVAVLASSGVVNGQAPPRDSLVSLPDGDGAWTIRISTSGGFTGRGRGNVTVTSLGNLTCLQTLRPCGNKLIDDKLRPISRLVSSFDLSKWVNSTPAEAVVCNDCYTTTMTFTRRDGGEVKTTILSWNDVTQGRVPPDVIKIVEMALSGEW